MPHATQPFPRVALILRSAPGDSLLLMTVARKLRLNSIAVAVRGQQINDMRSRVSVRKVSEAFDRLRALIANA
jgi:heptosyltransferase III